MNVLIIMSDTFRRDHLAAYEVEAPWRRAGRSGEPFIRTPHLDRLAAQSALFDRFYCGSYPTIPCRYDLFAGRFGFVTRGWQPLEPDDRVLSDLVAEAGALPAMIFDTPMLAVDSYNYIRGFAGWEFIRGQHSDRYNVDPITPPYPAARHKLKNLGATQLYLRNTAARRLERDWMCARTAAATCEWLERNRTRENFVLWIDMWDPHEPFDAPEFDLARYADPGFRGDSIIYPMYGRPTYMSEAERNHVRALYGALVTAVDRAVGRILDTVETVGLDRNTLVIFLSDHGHLFGEHGLQGKPTGPFGQLYEVTTRVPLLIRHPEGLGAGRRIPALAQHPDLLPTVLEFLGIRAPDAVQGKSLWPLIRGETEDLRDVAVSGRYSKIADEPPGTFVLRSDASAFDGTAGLAVQAEPITVTTDRWSYLCPARGGGARELYDLRADPGQTANVLERHPDVAADLHRALRTFLEQHGAPPERVALYPAEARVHERETLIPRDTLLYAVEQDDGQVFAFLARKDAEARFGGGASAPAIRETRLGALRRDRPKALVHMDDQYYWAEDLA